MWAIEDSHSPKVAYRGGGIILTPAILLVHTGVPRLFAGSQLAHS